MIFTTIDPLGRTICCNETQWQHIMDGHPIMNNNIESVKNTIEDPKVIYKSSQSATRNVYFKSDPASSYEPLYTKVVVEIAADSKNGAVISAWPQKTISGGIDEGGLLYVKTRL